MSEATSTSSRWRPTLRNYFRQSLDDSPSHAQILGGGEFRKKGSQVKNWKIRSYYIKDDAKMIYFDPTTKEPKGVVDLKEFGISIGPKENLHISGCSDFSREEGVSIILTLIAEARKMEIVFDALKEAQKFCLLAGRVALASNVAVTKCKSISFMSLSSNQRISFI
jgi:hypothetical protein